MNCRIYGVFVPLFRHGFSLEISAGLASVSCQCVCAGLPVSIEQRKPVTLAPEDLEPVEAGFCSCGGCLDHLMRCEDSHVIAWLLDFRAWYFLR